MTANLKVEKLRRDHVVEGFDCGKEPLTRFLIRNALQNQQANASQTYVLVADDRVVGYHTLVVGEVAHADAPGRLKKGLARHPIPIMLLARLAVAKDWQGKGLGSVLLKDGHAPHLFRVLDWIFYQQGESSWDTDTAKNSGVRRFALRRRAGLPANRLHQIWALAFRH